MLHYTTCFLFDKTMKTVLLEKVHGGPENAAKRGFTVQTSAEGAKDAAETLKSTIAVIFGINLDHVGLKRLGTVTDTHEGREIESQFFYGIMNGKACIDVERAITRQSVDRQEPTSRYILFENVDAMRHASVNDELYAGDGLQVYFLNQACRDAGKCGTRDPEYSVVKTHARQGKTVPYIRSMPEEGARRVKDLLNQAETDDDVSYKVTPAID